MWLGMHKHKCTHARTQRFICCTPIHCAHFASIRESNNNWTYTRTHTHAHMYNTPARYCHCMYVCVHAPLEEEVVCLFVEVPSSMLSSLCGKHCSVADCFYSSKYTYICSAIEKYENMWFDRW